MATHTSSGNSTEINDKNTFCTYLLTIRRVRFNRDEAVDFHKYFVTLVLAGCEVLVVDGSPSEVFAEHAKEWRGVCRHEPVDPQYKYLNGKVNGIHTGVALAAHDSIILADDDIRYMPSDVRRMAKLLANYDMVRPQNYFRPLPVWARTEAARMLINRAWIAEGDYSGTLGVTKEAMRRVGHYDGDVLFDNEEIVRHFQSKGARICYARDFFLLKLPPTFEKWVEQRPRQAYEDFVMRAKTLFFAAVPLVLSLALLNSGWRTTLICAALISLGAIVSAALGLGDGATKFFPPRMIFYAPLWIAERCFSTYWAFYWYLTRGGYPFGDKVVAKGTGRAWNAEAAGENDADSAG
ncbi:MAG TPA: glycosyltransferase family 2 protein [Pyrinomonadaceae bacterium]|jgi:cellulose synthase/poly-beta-1,6-N-acetylglucosamine synthase-like glycosyltransferase